MSDVRVDLPPNVWHFRGKGVFSGRTDRRGLLRIHHPWLESTAGHSGEWTTEAMLRTDQLEGERVWECL